VGNDPIKDVRCVPSAANTLLVTVTIELADYVAQCCVNPEAAFVEFIGESQHVKANFRLRDHRPGYLMEATIKLPARGTYTYRIAAKVLDRTLMQEGTYLAH